MYARLPSFVYGFHGCAVETANNVLVKGEHLRASTNTYDWLGHGVYFWENNYSRAVEWAEIHDPGNSAVIGAIIDLGNCLNLSDSGYFPALKTAYDILQLRTMFQNKPMPENRGENPDKRLRDLDCSVIEQVHKYARSQNTRGFDTVRGLFIEGNPIYPGSGLFEKTHIQICVVNPNCIKGYFRPLLENPGYPMP